MQRIMQQSGKSELAGWQAAGVSLALMHGESPLAEFGHDDLVNIFRCTQGLRTVPVPQALLMAWVNL